MNVASLDLCKELYELSGWDDDTLPHFDHEETGGPNTIDNVPAYDLGYLLGKLPQAYTDPNTRKLTTLNVYRAQPNNSGFMAWWNASYNRRGSAEKFRCMAGTPEAATCMLAIELFKQGILK